MLRAPPLGHAERDHPAADPGAVQQDLPGGEAGRRDHVQGLGGPHAQDHLAEVVPEVSTGSNKKITEERCSCDLYRCMKKSIR